MHLLMRIYAEHLKHCSTNYMILIAICFTRCLVHGFLPETLMSIVLVPIIKDKSGKINSKDNYRPIAIASNISKLLEILLLARGDIHVDPVEYIVGYIAYLARRVKIQ